MYHLNSEDFVKVERYLLIGKDAGRIVVRPSSSIYLLLPAPLAKKLKNDFHLDIKGDSNIEKRAELVLENDGVKVIYSFRKTPEVTSQKPDEEA